MLETVINQVTLVSIFEQSVLAGIANQHFADVGLGTIKEVRKMCPGYFPVHSTPLPFFLSFFPWLEAIQERIREVGQGRAFCARRASGRSEAESLDQPPALRTIVCGKMKSTKRLPLISALLARARPIS